MSDKKEKTYEFTERTEFNYSTKNPIEKKIILKESELQERHLSMLLGGLIHKYENSPELTKVKFREYLSEKHKI